MCSARKTIDLTDLTLLVPDKADKERDAVCLAWGSHGGDIVRLARFWEPPNTLQPQAIRLYGNDTFCLVVAQKLGLNLVSPSDDLPKLVTRQWWKRDVRIMSLADVRAQPFPAFVKPIVPKQFTARVYGSAEALDQECRGLDASTEVLRSAIVSFEAEARAFVLDGQVLDCAIYEGHAEVKVAEAFAQEFCNGAILPVTGVVDVGLIKGQGWAFIEANASWGAGLNGCNADCVLPAIERATRMANPENRRTDLK